MSFKDRFRSAGGSEDPETSTLWTTPWAWRDDDGCYFGHDGSAWLYREFPLSPIAGEWEDVGVRLNLGGQLEQALIELGESSKESPLAIAGVGADNRDIHMVAITWDRLATPPKGTPDGLKPYLEESLGFLVPAKTLLIGVRLRGAGGLDLTRKTSLMAQLKEIGTQLLAEATPDPDRFEADRATVAAILGRAGCKAPRADALRQLESWYNLGRGTDALIVEERDHITVDGVDQIELAAVQDFDVSVRRAPHFQWVLDAETHEEPCRVVSIRAELEPPSTARKRARSTMRRIKSQIDEEMQANDLENPEYSDTFQLAQSLEDHFINANEPLLTKVSMIMARRANDAPETYVDRLRNDLQIDVRPLTMRQLPALTETLPCAVQRVNPFLQDLSVGMIAYAGLHGFSDLGDSKGVFVGLTHPNLTPCFMEPLGAPANNKPPLTAVFGDPGSGKAVTLVTPIPTPSGWTTMGELKVGDQVFGRDGSPCTVTFLSDVNETPELYDVHLSDGQVVRACVDHQWIVSTAAGRKIGSRPNRLAAIENFETSTARAARLEMLADSVPVEAIYTERQLTELLDRQVPGHPWRKSVDATLRRIGQQPVPIEADCVIEASAVVATVAPSTVYPVRSVIEACRDAWSARTSGAWVKKSAERAAACDRLLETVDRDEVDGITNIARRLADAGAPSTSPKTFALQVAANIRAAGLSGQAGTIVVEPVERGAHVRRRTVSGWAAASALRALASDLRRKHAVRPTLEVGEQVLTTGALLKAGVATQGGATNWAIRVTAPLELPEADLPVDPYVLGAWLGDGSRGGGHIAAGFSATCTDSETGRADQDHMAERLRAGGFEPRSVPSNPFVLSSPGLGPLLRSLGVLRHKYIPQAYLRASRAQRLALLQGLMDTDGSVSENGCCEISLCDERLALDTLELIRSLGIKVSMTKGDAAITEADPDNPGKKRQRVTSTRYRMHFTTSVEVFTLPRKVRRLPETTRKTQQWLYITAIEPVAPEPARCIQVDSPDHSYLVAGFVPTHNTYLSSMMALQTNMSGLPVFFINPKGGDTLAPLAHAANGKVVQISKMEADGGAFDPFRFIDEPTTAAEVLATHILSVLTGFTEKEELDLTSGLVRGAENGARCALDALRSVTNRDVVQRVLDQAKASQTFCLGFGFKPQPPLTADKALTLIEFDRNLDLPDPNKSFSEYSRQERIMLSAMAIVTSASIEILRKAGGGMLVIDEAWTFLAHPAGKAAIQRMGRLGRSLNVNVVAVTQRVQDLVGSDMEGYLSRVFVMALHDEKEASAALKLCGVEASTARLRWLSQAGPQQEEGGQPGRWAMALHRDLKDRHAAVLVGPVPAWAHRAFTTNPAERARIREQMAREAQQNKTSDGQHS